MKEGPDITEIAALLGDPARAHMVGALMHGQALTAGELAAEAGVTAQTASGHLAKLQAGGLVLVAHEGRHRYYRLAGSDVARAVEALSAVAAARSGLRTRPGPRDAQMRACRVCYDHLAGALAVDLFERWVAAGWLSPPDEPSLTPTGARAVAALGIAIEPLTRGRRPVCRACMDWSERRHHLGGALGAAVLAHALTSGWAHRVEGSRALIFTPNGRRQFARLLPETPSHQPAAGATGRAQAPD